MVTWDESWKNSKNYLLKKYQNTSKYDRKQQKQQTENQKQVNSTFNTKVHFISTNNDQTSVIGQSSDKKSTTQPSEYHR